MFDMFGGINYTQQNINVLDYITDNSVKEFVDAMLAGLYDHINRQRNDKIFWKDLLTTYRYRSSYINYHMKYKENRKITDEKYLLCKYFLHGIETNDSYHYFKKNDTRIHLLRTKYSNASALLDYDEYVNDILYVNIYNKLLKGMPKYELNNEDYDKIVNLCNKKLGLAYEYGTIQKV